MASGSGHDKGGQGASAFRAFLRTLPDDIERAREVGLPVVLRVDRPLAVHAQRLMDTLGVEVVVAVAAQHELVTCPLRLCSWTWVGDPTKAESFVQAHLKLMHGSHSNDSVSAASVEAEKPEEARPVNQRWSREDAIVALRAHFDELGRVSSAMQWNTLGRRPAGATIYRLFGTWAAMVEATSSEREPQGEDPAGATAPATSSEPAFTAPAPSRSEDAEPAEAPAVLTVNDAALGVVRALRVFFETVERGLSD